MVNTLLALHLAGAAAVAGVIFFALLALWSKNNSATLRGYASAVALGGGFELVTGSLLAVTSQGTFFAFCTRIGLYLAIITLIEALLFVKMRKFSIPFPARLALGSMGAGTLSAVLSGVLIFAR